MIYNLISIKSGVALQDIIRPSLYGPLRSALSSLEHESILLLSLFGRTSSTEHFCRLSLWNANSFLPPDAKVLFAETMLQRATDHIHNSKRTMCRVCAKAYSILSPPFYASDTDSEKTKTQHIYPRGFFQPAPKSELSFSFPCLQNLTSTVFKTLTTSNPQKAKKIVFC